MKKGLSLIVLVIGLCGITNAQTTVVEEVILEKRLPGYKTTFEANPFWHNWYISANFGGNTLFAEHWSDAKFKNTITFMPNLAIGKWFNPWWGLRIQGGGGAFHGFTPGAESMLHYHFMYAHMDFMMGLITFFAPYKENRKFDIVPFFGFGGLGNTHQQSFTLNGGVQLRYALSPRFDINAEFQGMILNDKYVATGGFPNDGVGGLTLGVTYRFKNREFRKAPTNAEVMALAETNMLLANQVAKLANQKPEVKIVEKEVVKKEMVSQFKTLPATTIPFKFNSAELNDIYDPLIYNIAEFLKQNPNAKVRIVGYADKFGPININMKISEKRAQAVANALKSNYGINADRLVVEFVGKEKPYYKENKWNRCAIVEVVK